MIYATMVGADVSVAYDGAGVSEADSSKDVASRSPGGRYVSSGYKVSGVDV